MTFDDAGSELLWETRRVGRPVGTHFSAGGSSPLARADDTNKLETHAVLGDVVDEDDGPDDSNVALAVGLGALLTLGALGAARLVQGWWTSRPATEEKSAEAGDVNGAATSEGDTTSVAAFATEVEVALEQHRTEMCSAEAQRRIVDIMLAAAVIAENVRALSDAELDDDAHSKLKNALAELAAPDVADGINRALAADPSLLDDRTSGRVVELFGGGRTVDGRYVPLRSDRVAEVLTLPRVA
ncbi:hypothetical protein [Blastococcus goldschmidtiae]|uniref:GrpE protein n=1 Tax=Blastococcus goldschmidtiae TaxID=3075546 RepID=A0ABU2K8N2_9ACTN|nr:hypothetical protein [Blastococcus sp. DSM 46792]MDT0276539.1 hypothetical protein [Blastococcus sp. DSM 46792]